MKDACSSRILVKVYSLYLCKRSSRRFLVSCFAFSSFSFFSRLYYFVPAFFLFAPIFFTFDACILLINSDGLRGENEMPIIPCFHEDVNFLDLSKLKNGE